MGAKPKVVASPAAEVQRMADNDISMYIRDKFDAQAASGLKMSQERAIEVFDGIVQLLFRHAILSGSFRLPAGYGALALRLRKATRRRINDVIVDVPSMPYVRYTEGDAVRIALGKKDHYTGRKKQPKTVL